MFARIAAGLFAAVWSLLLLPVQLVEWMAPGDTPGWARAMNGWPTSDALRALAESAGWADRYLVFGVGIVHAMLLAWWAMHRTLRTLGGWGVALSIGWFTVAPVTALSYLNHPADAPLHSLWGAEAFALLAVFVLAFVAAVAAPRALPARRVTRVLVACSALFGVAATALLGYHPHGTYVGVGVLAVLLAATTKAESRDDRELPASG